MIRYACPSCGQKYESKISVAGQTHECSMCGQLVQVPTPDGTAASSNQALPEPFDASLCDPGSPEKDFPGPHWWGGMKPAAWLVLALVLVAPLVGLIVMGTIAANRSEVVIGSMSDEQSAQWAKYRRDWKHAPWNVAGRTLDGEWGLVPFEWPTDNDERGLRTKEAAAEAARLSAQDPNAVVTVVIDLFSGEAPRVHEWYLDEGKGVRVYSRAPKSEWDKELRTKLQEVQQGITAGKKLFKKFLSP